ncbi:MAG TPA: signal peptidase II [Bryobacteraceae bacterium]|nr:signal peptidase II [Bryobacteraceae bacterium]
MTRNSSRVLPLAIASAIVMLDRITKIAIERYVSQWESYTVIPGFFDLVHAKNAGAAFGMFAQGESELRTFLLIGVSVAVMVFVSILLFRPHRGGFTSSTLTTVALSLVLGGALGNVWDRVLKGTVTDFLEFYVGQYRFAAFNVADSAISVGAGLLLIDIWRTRHHPART